MALLRIDDLAAVEEFPNLLSLSIDESYRDRFSFFCPQELAVRHAEVTLISAPIAYFQQPKSASGLFLGGNYINHQLFRVICGNCRSQSIFLYYRAFNDNRMILVHPEVLDKQTPGMSSEMQYYLSQARRSHSVGANSAAVAMYRAALEQFLYHQGYTEGMLNQKIRALETAMAGENPPRWSRDFDTDYLDIIKSLGNTAIHPNNGDITKQNALDADLIANLEIIFADIIDKAFEAPAREAARKAKLRGGISR